MKSKSLDSPNYPAEQPGVHALQSMSQALNRQAAHDDWHHEHPGEPCPAGDWPKFLQDSAAIECGEDVMDFAGGGTIEPGDALRRK